MTQWALLPLRVLGVVGALAMVLIPISPHSQLGGLASTTLLLGALLASALVLGRTISVLFRVAPAAWTTDWPKGRWLLAVSYGAWLCVVVLNEQLRLFPVTSWLLVITALVGLGVLISAVTVEVAKRRRSHQ